MTMKLSMPEMKWRDPVATHCDQIQAQIQITAEDTCPFLGGELNVGRHWHMPLRTHTLRACGRVRLVLSTLEV